MSNKEYTYKWDAQKDFLEKYRDLIERVKHGDHGLLSGKRVAYKGVS